MKRNAPVVFKVSVETVENVPLVVLRIAEGNSEEVYEMEADDAIVSATQLIRAGHEVRRRQEV